MKTFYIEIATINKAKQDIDEICRRQGYTNLTHHNFGKGGVGRFMTKLVSVTSILWKLKSGDRLLLLTDGIFNTLSEAEVSAVLESEKTAEQAAAVVHVAVEARPGTKLLHPFDLARVLAQVRLDGETVFLHELAQPLQDAVAA